MDALKSPDPELDKLLETKPWLTDQALAATAQPFQSAATLPGPIFSDADIYAREQRVLFGRSWMCVAREDDLPNPGTFQTFEISGSGVVVVRDSHDVLRAFHNVCRHRGTRLVEADHGSGLKRILCPYHAWTYDLSGRVIGTPHMGEARDFQREDFGLHPVRLESWRGFVFVNLDPKAKPLHDQLAPFERRAAPYPLERLRRAHRVVYDIAANWKLIVQNANECYHCPGVHPQLVRLTPYRSGEEDILTGPVFGGWMDFVKGVHTLTPTGRTSRTPFAGLSGADLKRVYYYVLYPGNFLSFLPDYVTLDWFQPMGPDRTRLVFEIFVDRDETDPAADAMDFWETTNRQDWHICEMAHLGSRTLAYTQGRYSSEEEVVHLVDAYYLHQMGFLPSARNGGRSLRAGRSVRGATAHRPDRRPRP